MDNQTPSIAPGVIIERVGDDLVVIVPGATEVLRLSGDSAATVRSVQAGDTAVLSPQVIGELVERGVLVSPAGLSRRGLVKAGTIGAGAGIAALAMPGVAAASSVAATRLVGLLDGELWNRLTYAPNISAKLGITADGDSFVGVLFIPQGAPYSISGLGVDDPVLDGGVAVEGTIVAGGLTRTAYLYAYAANQSDPPGAVWFFKGTWTIGDASTVNPQPGSNFELTFTFDGKRYTVTPGTPG